jgi:hypothetical protein
VASLSADLFWSLTPAEVDDILREALSEWQARDRAAAHNAALICATLCNCHRDPKSHPQPFTASDFLPEIEDDEPEETPEPTQEEIASKARRAMDLLTKVNQ